MRSQRPSWKMQLDMRRQGGVAGNGHRTVRMWSLPAVRPATKGTLGRPLNAMSRAVALTEGAVGEEPAGHRTKAEE